MASLMLYGLYEGVVHTGRCRVNGSPDVRMCPEHDQLDASRPLDWQV